MRPAMSRIPNNHIATPAIMDLSAVGKFLECFSTLNHVVCFNSLGSISAHYIIYEFCS